MDSSLEKLNDDLAFEVERVHAILESIGDGIIITDENAKILMINKAAEEMFGYSARDIINLQIEKILDLSDEKGHTPISEKDYPAYKALLTGNKQVGQYSAKTLGEKIIPLEITASRIFFKEKTAGAVCVYRDLTPQKALDKMKDDFVSLAAHQLRGPLAIARWSVELFTPEEINSLPQSVSEKIKDIYDSTKTMIALVNDLLDVSHIDQGKVPDDPTNVDLIAATHEAVDIVQKIANNTNVKINIVTSLSNFQMIIDRKRFIQVVDNLLTNAVKFSKQGQEVEVSLLADENKFHLSVTDHGIGIPNDEIEKIGSKFFRGANGVKLGISGTGLGLYMINSYVLGWGGKLSFESVENQGTTFNIELPLKK